MLAWSAVFPLQCDFDAANIRASFLRFPRFAHHHDCDPIIEAAVSLSPIQVILHSHVKQGSRPYVLFVRPANHTLGVCVCTKRMVVHLNHGLSKLMSKFNHKGCLARMEKMVAQQRRQLDTVVVH